MVLLFWDLLIFDRIFISPKVKRSVIFSNKEGMYVFPEELPIKLRVGIWGNYKMSGKSQNYIELLPSAQPSSQKEKIFQ